MDILIRQAHIIDPFSPFHQQQLDIFIQNGVIAEIGQIPDRSFDKEINIRGLHISPGWTELFSHFCDPGLEYKETLETGSFAAAYGGYTDVCLIPNTIPVINSKSGAEYILQRSRTLPVTIYPLGAITKNAEGKELSEMYDMHSNGAIAFSDGTNPVQSSGLLLKALQYTKAIDGVIIQLPDDKSISASGLINEGIESTRLGLPGKPAIAEELMVSRDIEIAEYTESRLHITGISTARSLDLIRKAKIRGIDVTCSVTPYHLYFTDEDLFDYNTDLKVNPPLRSKNDRNALIEGLINGGIDAVATHHFPQDRDHKMVEFEYAHYGMLGLETTFSLLRTGIPELSLDRIIELISLNPRRILNLPPYIINQKATASLSLFFPDEKWKVNILQSKSSNSPFIGKELTGRPIGIINKDKLFLNQQF